MSKIFFIPEGRKKSKTETGFTLATYLTCEGESVIYRESIDKCEQFEEEVSDEATLDLKKHKKLYIASHSSVMIS